MGDYDPINKETAVYSTIEVPGLKPDYGLMDKFEQLYLGDLIKALEEYNPEILFNVGFCNPHSWRGVYAELAVEPARNVKVSQMIDLLKASMGVEFQGYKGGWFIFSEYTEVHIDEYGRSSGTHFSKMLLEAMRTYNG